MKIFEKCMNFQGVELSFHLGFNLIQQTFRGLPGSFRLCVRSWVITINKANSLPSRRSQCRYGQKLGRTAWHFQLRLQKACATSLLLSFNQAIKNLPVRPIVELKVPHAAVQSRTIWLEFGEEQGLTGHPIRAGDYLRLTESGTTSVNWKMERKGKGALSLPRCPHHFLIGSTKHRREDNDKMKNISTSEPQRSVCGCERHALASSLPKGWRSLNEESSAQRF